MREVQATLIAGLTLVVIAIGVVLAHAPATLAGTNGVTANEEWGEVSGDTKICQASEMLPSKSSGIAISLSAFHGPRVTAELLSDERVVTRGQQGSNWSGQTITIPVKPLNQVVHNVTLCLIFSAQHEPIGLFGEPFPPAAAATYNGAILPGRLRIEYLQPGRRSWWSLVASTAYHLGLGRTASGTWVSILAFALMITAVATLSRALLKESQ